MFNSSRTYILSLRLAESGATVGVFSDRILSFKETDPNDYTKGSVIMVEGCFEIAVKEDYETILKLLTGGSHA